MTRLCLLLFSSLVLFGSFSKKQNKRLISYLPLGDSYTICTGASEKEAWPVLLSKHLNDAAIKCSLLENPARNGYSTQDLIAKELPLVKKLKPDFVTLLIGVNDWVRQVPKEIFIKNLTYILDELEKNLAQPKHILLITIPDFGVTPTGKSYSGGRDISKGISEFNDEIKKAASGRGLRVADIFEISKKMGADQSLVAGDGLHPSGKEYAIWEKMILPETIALLKNK